MSYYISDTMSISSDPCTYIPPPPIRTRAPWDATLLATRFGGGGHIRAAGCTIKGGMAVAKRLMRKAVKEMLTAK